jgi:hypothetical protein
MLLLSDSHRAYCVSRDKGLSMSLGEILRLYCVLRTEMCRTCEVTDTAERLFGTVLGACMKYQFLMQQTGQPTDTTLR